jgi:hypothetical protein
MGGDGEVGLFILRFRLLTDPQGRQGFIETIEPVPSSR